MGKVNKPTAVYSSAYGMYFVVLVKIFKSLYNSIKLVMIDQNSLWC